MALEIRKPTENRFVKALFFSPGGAGKTVLVGTAQLDDRTSPMLFLDFEGGDESLAGLDIDIAEIRSWEDWNEVYEMLVSGDHGYKSVGVDSISETHKWALLSILDKEQATRKNPDLLEQRDYGTATVQMRRLLRSFRDLPMHVFFTAHAKEIEIPREGRVRVPDLSGQMAEEVAGLMSVVGYLAQYEEDGEMQRTLLLHSFPKFRIKVRTPWETAVPEELVNPTVTDLLDMLGYEHVENGEVKAKASRPRRQRSSSSAKRRQQIDEAEAKQEVKADGDEATDETPGEGEAGGDTE